MASMIVNIVDWTLRLLVWTALFVPLTIYFAEAQKPGATHSAAFERTYVRILRPLFPEMKMPPDPQEAYFKQYYEQLERQCRADEAKPPATVLIQGKRTELPSGSCLKLTMPMIDLSRPKFVGENAFWLGVAGSVIMLLIEAILKTIAVSGARNEIEQNTNTNTGT